MTKRRFLLGAIVSHPLSLHANRVANLVAAGGANDVAFDAATETATGFTEASADPFTFNHTPAGTPMGVLVLIVHGTVSSDIITAVTYGGVSMTRVADAQDTATEQGAAYAYFLGSNVPTGVQTVSIDHDSATTAFRWAVCITVTANGNTSIGDFGIAEENQANPAITLDTGATESLRFAALFSGIPDPASVTAQSGSTIVHDYDIGISAASSLRQDSRASGAVAVGFTSASDDVAMVAVAIQ